MIVSDTIRITGAQRFGADPNSCKDMGGTDGAVYSCRVGSRGYVLKFLPMQDSDIPEYEEKLAFVHYLAEHGVPITLPVNSLAGNPFERILEEEASYIAILTPLAEGRHPQSRNLYDWNPRLFQTWGQVIGKMHALTRQYPSWERTDSSPTRLMGWREEHRFFTEWSQEPEITARWEELYAPLEGLPRDRSSYGLIHNDMHPRNFFYQPDARHGHPITIIDFDVCGFHWFITDISIALYHAMTESGGGTLATRRRFAREFLGPFLAGYQQENDLDESWLAHLPLFVKYREILLYIALTNSWPAAQRKPWQNRFLAEKRARTLRGEQLL